LTGEAVPERAREVVLPVCGECGTVGRQPGQGTAAAFCVGPREARHKRVKMQPVTYRAQ
jgi:hypothetical protein